MKTAKKKTIKIEGVSLDAAAVSAMSRTEWAKHAKDAGYFSSVGRSTPTDEQRAEVTNRAYDLAHKEMGTTEAKAAPAKADDKKQ
jgi:hypothetical protein